MKLQTVITVTPPDGTAPVVLATADPDGAFTVPAAVIEATLSWGAPSGLSHPQPGEGRLSVYADRPDHPALTFGAMINITATYTLHGRPSSVVLWDGPVQEVTSIDLVAGRPGLWLYQLDLTDQLGRWASTKIGAEPWPAADVYTRQEQINAAAGGSMFWPDSVPSPGFDLPYNNVIDRDVDALPALEVAQRTASSQAFTVHQDRGRLIFLDSPTALLTFWTDTSKPGWPETFGELQKAPAPLQAPADALAWTPRQINRSGHISQATVKLWSWDTESEDYTETTRVFSRPLGLPTSEFELETDLYALPADIATFAQSVLTTGDTAVTTFAGPVEVYTDRLPDTDAAAQLLDALLDLDGQLTTGRSNFVLKIDQPPAGVPEYVRAHAGQLIINGNPQLSDRLAITVEPAELSGARYLTVGDLDERVTFDQFINATDAGEVTLGDLSAPLNFRTTS